MAIFDALLKTGAIILTMRLEQSEARPSVRRNSILKGMLVAGGVSLASLTGSGEANAALMHDIMCQELTQQKNSTLSETRLTVTNSDKTVAQRIRQLSKGEIVFVSLSGYDNHVKLNIDKDAGGTVYVGTSGWRHSVQIEGSMGRILFQGSGADHKLTIMRKSGVIPDIGNDGSSPATISVDDQPFIARPMKETERCMIIKLNDQYQEQQRKLQQLERRSTKN